MNKDVSRETFLPLLAGNLEKEKITVTDEFGEMMWLFYEALLKWNKTHKLTANSEMERFIERQLVDSLLFTTLSEEMNEKKCLDFGSGGGFPGIPLALYYEEASFTLSDIIRKKTSFLSYAKAILSGDNIAVFMGNALTLSLSFDYIFLKAVSNEKDFLSSLAPLLAKNGSIVLYHAPAFKPALPHSLLLHKSTINHSAASAISLIKHA
ncbi:16S rRNA (guanine(527)-N(7))-methyltransferase RsmG [bacterium]|nr:16S rRNA (guanine(527)-N(7))-methyltransferase RsmG [bacterium]